MRACHHMLKNNFSEGKNGTPIRHKKSRDLYNDEGDLRIKYF